MPPDRAVWVPARLAHAIDVLADIEMRTLYFDLAWLKRERRAARAWREEFVVRVSPLLHQAILALFDAHRRPRARRAADQARHARTAPGRRFRHLHPAAAGAALPPRRRARAGRRRPPPTRSRPWRERSAPRRGRCRGCSPRRPSSASRAWCQRARIAAAIERLSTDSTVSIKQLASELGYASMPAFSHAFRQVTGKTPSEFVQQEGRSIAVASRAARPSQRLDKFLCLIVTTFATNQCKIDAALRRN